MTGVKVSECCTQQNCGVKVLSPDYSPPFLSRAGTCDNGQTSLHLGGDRLRTANIYLQLRSFWCVRCTRLWAQFAFSLLCSAIGENLLAKISDNLAILYSIDSSIRSAQSWFGGSKMSKKDINAIRRIFHRFKIFLWSCLSCVSITCDT